MAESMGTLPSWNTILYRNPIRSSQMVLTCVTCLKTFDPFHKNSNRAKFCSRKCKLLASCKRNENGCWEWQRKKWSNKYAQLMWRGKKFMAHRVSFAEWVEPIKEGNIICHKCDNPLCINPEHLFQGTYLDNSRDAVKKGRMPKGEKSYLHKLTDAQVKEMRLLKNEGISLDRLGRIFNTNVSNVVSIIKNRSRKILEIDDAK